MATTVRGAVRELLEQTIATMDALLEASDRELPLASSHARAQGKDLWTLITNDIDHEKIHTGQVLEGRYESRLTASPMQRLIAEWLAERARLINRRAHRRAIQCRDRARPVDVSSDRQAPSQRRAGFPEDARRRPSGPRQRRGSDRALI